MKPTLVSTDSISNEIPRLIELNNRVQAGDSSVAGIQRVAFEKSLLRKRFARRQQLFYLLGDGRGNRETSAAVVARVSPTLRDDDGKPVGLLGFFDALDSTELAEEVLCAADGWLRDQGCESIVGPINGDTWHPYRFNVGPHSEPPFLLEPTNQGYYPKLFLSTGFEVVDRYHSLRVDNIERILPELRPAWSSAIERGFRFRSFRLDRFQQDLRTIYDVSIASYRNNFLYEDISWEEFYELYRDVKPLIQPKLVWFVEDEHGNVVGFLFCLVDYYRAVASMKGRTGILSKLRFLWHRSAAECVNFKSIALIPECRREKLGSALMYLGYQESTKLGFSKANLCLIRDGNPSSRLDGGNSRMLRRYELYQTPGSRLSQMMNQPASVPGDPGGGFESARRREE